MSEVKTEVKEAEVNQENVTDVEIDENAPVEFNSLFGGDEDVTEAELKGEEKPSQEEEPASSESLDDEAKPDGESTEVKPDDESGMIKAPDLTGDEETIKDGEIEGKSVDGGEEKPDYSKPPPKGYVALPALQEERRNVQNLRAQVSTLQTQIEQDAQEVESKEKEAEQEEFKVISDSEFEELLEEDPDAALLYEHKLRQHEKSKSEERAEKTKQQRPN